VPYELKRYQRDPASGLAPAKYKSLHPMGIAPVIADGPLVLGESGAIIEYVGAKYGNRRLAVSADKPNRTVIMANTPFSPSIETRLSSRFYKHCPQRVPVGAGLEFVNL
jgi:glutathione S-transferase